MPIPFSAEPKLLNEIFGRDITYIIPDYQRPYSWQCVGKSDKNNQVNVMWDDLYNHFERKTSSQQPDYFFGSIVLIDKKNQNFEVIDGQQRLTTTLLLFAAIKSFLKSITPSDADIISFKENVIGFVNDFIYNKKLVGVTPTEKKLKIEKNLEYDYDKVFGFVVEDASTVPQNLIDQASDDQKVVINRFISNHNYFQEKVFVSFTTAREFSTNDAERLNAFIEFLKNEVSVVKILAGDFNIAYHVFEILNNRGLPLSNRDLFRNLIIKEYDLLKKSNPTAYANLIPGKKWVDLESNYDITDEFIGRWVESYNADQPRSSAFNDLKEIYITRYSDSLRKKKIEIFYDDIKRDASYYTDIVNNNIKDSNIKASVSFILNSPNIRYGLNFLLALSKRLGGLEKDGPLTLKFLKEYEKFILDALLVSRFNYGVVYRTIRYLNGNDQNNALTEFSKNYDLASIKEKLNSSIRDNEIAKILIAKCIWLNQATTDEDVVQQTLNYKDCTLEHIIPQNPEVNTNWVTDFPEEFRNENVYKLGNMTLVTTKLNSSARNFDFEKKKLQYAKTKLNLTTELLQIQKILPSVIEERQRRITETLINDLN